MYFFDRDLRVTHLGKGEAALFCGVEKVGLMKSFVTGSLGLGRTSEITITNPEIPLYSMSLNLLRASLSTIYWEAKIYGPQLEVAQIRFIQDGFFRQESCVLQYKAMDVMKTGRSFFQTLAGRKSSFSASIESGPPFSHSAKFLMINRGWGDSPSVTFGLTSDPLCNSLVLALSQEYDHENILRTNS